MLKRSSPLGYIASMVSVASRFLLNDDDRWESDSAQLHYRASKTEQEGWWTFIELQCIVSPSKHPLTYLDARAHTHIHTRTHVYTRTQTQMHTDCDRHTR